MDDASTEKCTPSSGEIAVAEGDNISECPKSEEKEEDWLLPRIPDGITLDQICTKLPWNAFYVLSSVSPAWRRAIQSHCVYEARVRSQATDTLVVHYHYLEEEETHQVVALYSTRDKRCFELPPIPGVERGIPWQCECVSSDGKVYVLGGANEFQSQELSMFEKKYHSGEDDKKEVYKEVYVLDLAGQRQWRRCESMHEGRHRFASGTLNGRIHAFGGDGSSGPVSVSEVYDPIANAWSAVKPMPCLRVGDCHTVTVGEEICVYGGASFDATEAEYARRYAYGDPWVGGDFKEEALDLKVYHQTKDEWRVVDPFLLKGVSTRAVFEKQGKLHILSSYGISVYVSERNEWQALYKNSFAAIGPVKSTKVLPCAATVVDDVLFANVHFARVNWKRNEGRVTGGVTGSRRDFGRITFGICLLEGRGFGSPKEEIEWQIISTCRCDFEDILHAMQL